MALRGMSPKQASREAYADAVSTKAIAAVAEVQTPRQPDLVL